MKFGKIKITEVQNLCLNMMSGLLPENLTEKEVKLLVKEFGEDWFKKLGYAEPEYKKPKF